MNLFGPVRLSVRLRWSLAALGACLLVPLVVAALLRPNPRGLGTHQQLGLPPCTFIMLFGRRCPACGMTTSWSHLVRGHVREALEANVGGTLLALLAGGLCGWSWISALRGRWLGGLPSDRAWLAAAILVVVITVIDWIRRLLAG